jgi:hypothetical protein
MGACFRRRRRARSAGGTAAASAASVTEEKTAGSVRGQARVSGKSEPTGLTHVTWHRRGEKLTDGEGFRGRGRSGGGGLVLQRGGHQVGSGPPQASKKEAMWYTVVALNEGVMAVAAGGNLAVATASPSGLPRQKATEGLEGVVAPRVCQRVWHTTLTGGGFDG